MTDDGETDHEDSSSTPHRMEFETPAELLARLKLGREEFCQRLLTTLILGAPYPRWNTRSRACAEGTAFLRDLHDLSFGSRWPGDDFLFVDELELPARTPDEKGGYPDYGLLWADRVWIIELKTEPGSHRPAQIPYYFELARHHHATCDIDFTYLTGPGSKSGAATQPHERFCHLEWSDVIELIDRHWPDPILPGQAAVVGGLTDTIRALDQPAKAWRESHADLYGAVTSSPQPLPDPTERSLEAAELVAHDGDQRAVEFRAASLDELHELRVRIQEELAATPPDDPRRHVRPWVWRWESQGQPLTEAGRETGYELRLSRYAKPQY